MTKTNAVNALFAQTWAKMNFTENKGSVSF